MDPKSLTADFRDFLKCLNDHGVEYLLIGGHAVAYHGYVRPTQDMDIWIRRWTIFREALIACFYLVVGSRNKRPWPASSDTWKPGIAGLSSSTGFSFPSAGFTSVTFDVSQSKVTVGHSL